MRSACTVRCTPLHSIVTHPALALALPQPRSSSSAASRISRTAGMSTIARGDHPHPHHHHAQQQHPQQQPQHYPQQQNQQQLHPVLELLTVIKACITAVFDPQPQAQPQTQQLQLTAGRGGGNGYERSCVDLLRRLLGAGAVGATDLRINALPARLLTADDKLEYDQNCCAICLDGYEQQNRVRVLACGHCYHVHCIDVWLRKRATCPMCQGVVC